MPSCSRSQDRCADRRGGALTLVALLLPVLVLLAGFAVNFAYMDLIRTETFVAADAATRAGGRTFALTGDLDIVKLRAREAARRNPVGGRPLLLDDADFVLGRSVRGAQSPTGEGQTNVGNGENYNSNYGSNASREAPANGEPTGPAGPSVEVPAEGELPPSNPTPHPTPTPVSAPLPGGRYFPWPSTTD